MLEKLRKSLFVGGIVLALTLGLSSTAKAVEAPQKSIGLNECTDKTLGIKMCCNPDWKLETDKGAVLMIIEDEAGLSVTATITTDFCKSNETL